MKQPARLVSDDAIAEMLETAREGLKEPGHHDWLIRSEDYAVLVPSRELYQALRELIQYRALRKAKR